MKGIGSKWGSRREEGSAVEQSLSDCKRSIKPYNDLGKEQSLQLWWKERRKISILADVWQDFWGSYSLVAFIFSYKVKERFPNRLYVGLPWWLSGKESVCQCRRAEFNSWVQKIPWKRKRQPTPVFLPGKSHGQRSLAGYSPWGRKRVGQDLVSEQQEQTGKLIE